MAQIQPAGPTLDTKERDAHIEQGEEEHDLKASTGNHVADTEARDYLNPDLVISEEENKRLRRRIHKR